MSARFGAFVAALLGCLAPARAELAQDGSPQVEAPAEKLEAWPELSREEHKALELEIAKLRKPRTDEMLADAEAALAQASAGAVPLLLTAFSKEKDPAAQGRLAAAMTGLTDARHTRLLGAEFAHAEARVRAFCLRRAAAFPDPGLAAQAAEALKRVQARGEKANEEELYAASLASVSSGSVEGLALLVEAAAKQWPERWQELRTAGSGARGPAATEALVASLAGERAAVLGALRMLGGAGDESAVRAVAPYLDNDDNQLRVAAINALRGIVDREPPIENLSVFRAIEVAQTWKGRVAR